MNSSGLVIGLGAQKSGTTWLAKYLNDHRDVSFSPIKELHYFDSLWIKSCQHFNKKFFMQLKDMLGRYDVEALIPSNDVKHAHLEHKMRALLARVQMIGKEDFSLSYKTYFEAICETNKVFGEITPSYSMLSSDHYEKIDSIFPNTKYIFLMRDPVDRFWSNLRFFYKNSSTRIDLSVVESCIEDERFLLRSDYGRTLNELLQVVSRHRVFVAFYEELFGDDGLRVIERLNSFLDISSVIPDFGKVVHVSRKVTMPTRIEAFLFEKLRFVYSDVKALGYTPPRLGWRH